MLGKRIEKLRKQKGLTQSELGKAFGFRDSTISQYETGKRKPDSDTLGKIADYFGVSTDYLLGKTNDRYLANDETPEEIAEIFDFIRRKSRDMTPDERKQLIKGIKAFIKAREEEK
jgi:transcriptional regulator with XRE-family HTH domain